MPVGRTSLARGGQRGARVIELCRAGLDSVALRRELRAELARVVAFDAYCVNTADPATLLVTGSVGDGLPPARTARLFEIEYAHDDVNKLASLASDAKGAARVAILGDAVAGDPTRSLRMREIFLPIGLGHELRAALRVGDACWGYLHLLRQTAKPDFTAPDAALVASLAPHIAEALRVALLLASLGEDTQAPPGLLTLRADGEVHHTNAAADHWLAELGGEITRPLPHALHAVAARVLAVTDDAPPTCRLRTRAGEWLVVHGSRLGDHVALVIERARSADLAPVILRAYGFTARERDLVVLAVRGLSNDEIAAALRLSLHTVKDHLKAIFAKAAVHTRAELAARIFADHYAPRIHRKAPLGPGGWFRA